MIRTADDFRAWMVAMGRKRGKASISVREASRELGYSRASISAILEGKRSVPLYIALACRARLYDVPELHADELREGPVYRVRLIEDRRGSQ
jgi:transcriptional regulator with XRE-family HTH domain